MVGTCILTTENPMVLRFEGSYTSEFSHVAHQCYFDVC